MADESEDQWLYGDSTDGKEYTSTNIQLEVPQNDSTLTEVQENLQMQEDQKVEGVDEIPSEIQEVTDSLGDGDEESSLLNNAQEENLDVSKNGTRDASSQEDGEAASESDSDDDVHVVIGDIKSAPTYGNLNIKRGGLLTNTSGVSDKLNKQPGKFSIDEFETIGVINGIPAHEFNLDQLEDKPWRQPGADITDYFNYGFNEDTWRAYCERQKRMRSESGVGLILNAGGGGSNPSGMRMPQVAITNDNSKYSGIMGPKRAGPPPGRKMAGTIDVIGSSGLASRRNLDKSPPKGNVIQVMTADRREYSRKPGFPDMSVPPPGAGMPPPPFDMPPPGYAGEPTPFYIPETDPYYQSYEPTQDNQWGNDPTWQPTNLAIPMTEGEDDKDMGPKTIPTMVPPTSIPPLMQPRDQRDGRDRERDRDRDREMDSMSRDRDKDRDRDRDREKDSMMRDRDRDRDSMTRDEDRERDRSRSQYRHKDRHRHRSRSRSRRHKSRSRSPTRSRKKKSRRSDRERSKEESE
ncbi:PREDICTED: pre-mRNA 3'-end-processing factor FIP1 [Cyphomyrmex costatus]|uniref:Pre-mRNA 3'-end-processing factor FIP1 n=1 Tax=Cyphomyrmex costatus TaxID=456900 RepID=A0A195CYC2_9HYME|nr:PREDICTED: pre-mRNA 3'-end-processing factor FIP1 [Cyphomyrmex costatus]KYN05653.1 Pre-mRNA 3'-end-processing factor FIP1 [Cyphomyrmex costatus]